MQKKPLTSCFNLSKTCWLWTQNEESYDNANRVLSMRQLLIFAEEHRIWDTPRTPVSVTCWVASLPSFLDRLYHHARDMHGKALLGKLVQIGCRVGTLSQHDTAEKTQSKQEATPAGEGSNLFHNRWLQGLCFCNPKWSRKICTYVGSCRQNVG